MAVALDRHTELNYWTSYDESESGPTRGEVESLFEQLRQRYGLAESRREVDATPYGSRRPYHLSYIEG